MKHITYNNNSRKSSYSTWRVTTLDDTGEYRLVGYYEGYLDHIALFLGTQCKYLYFEEVTIHTVNYGPIADEVYVSTTNPVTQSEFEYFTELLSDRNVDVVETDCPYSVKLVRWLTPEEKADKEIREILDRYSDEDKQRLLELLKERYTS